MAHILVVDDRPMNREYLVTLLGYYGHTLAEAGDGVEALERVRERKPDLAFVDLLMPNMDGEELMRRLKADPATRDMPLIIYTATYRAREAREIADRVGVVHLLPKPSEPQVIVAMVSKALGADQSESPSGAAPKGVAAQLDSVQGLNVRLAHLLDSAVQVASEQARSLTAVRALEAALQDVQSLGLRLTGLIEIGLDLSNARDPEELVGLFCRALQDIESSRYAGVVVLGEDRTPPRQFLARGLDEATSARLATEIGGCMAAKRVLGENGAGRLVIGTRESDITGLPPSHPPVATFLACPIAAHGKAIGWLYVADRLGEGGFSTDDERIAMTLGAQFALAWDSLRVSGELERLVAQRTRQLELSNTELEAFSYSVSHDLSAPLRAIDGFTRIVLEDHSDALTPDGQRQLQRVREQTAKMATMIDELLSLARVDRIELKLSPVKLGEFVRNCIREIVPETAGREVEWIVGELPTWNADPILLKQLFVNLLSNALKFTGRQAAPRIEIGAERRGAEEVVFVRDNGAGFDMAYAPKLFGMFKRLHSQQEYPGTGIGLAIVRRIATHHGARVWAEGEPDRGATFFIAFPAASPAA